MNIERKIRRNLIRKQQKKNAANADSIWSNAGNFEPCECSLCGAEIKGAYESNNPYPLGNEGDKCCNICNSTKVIPERFGLKGKEREEYVKQTLHAFTKQEAA